MSSAVNVSFLSASARKKCLTQKVGILHFSWTDSHDPNTIRQLYSCFTIWAWNQAFREAVSELNSHKNPNISAQPCGNSVYELCEEVAED